MRRNARYCALKRGERQNAGVCESFAKAKINGRAYGVFTIDLGQ